MIAEGTVLKGRYRLEMLHDSGGMADIYRGVDERTGRTVAVKVLKPEFAADKSHVTRFMKEARSVAQLKHKNIVRMYDSGAENGAYYIVFEFIEGRTLKQVIEKKGRVAPDRATRVMIDVCSAIGYAHGKGLVHRDIKPQNILVQKDGELKLTDFGIAKNVDMGATTGATEVMGSAHYLSPEQAMGKKVDARSDIYSLGIVFFELVTGVVPFDGDSSVAVAIKHINEPIREPKKLFDDIPRSVNSIILKATSKDPANRYASAEEMRSDLMRALVSPDANFVKVTKEHDERERKHRISLAAAAVGLVLVIVLSAVAIIGVNILKNRETSTIATPTLTGLTEVEAMAEATRVGIKLSITAEESDTVEKGVVIRQTPEAETTMDRDSTVSIVVSEGVSMFEIGSYLDMDIEAAREQIETDGLIVGEVMEQESDGPEGYVVGQLPEQGTMVSREDEVNLYVSKKPLSGKAAAPPLRTTLFDDAIATLKNAGFLNVFVYEKPLDENAAGTVVEQSPAAGVNTGVRDIFSLWVTSLPNKKYSAITTVTQVIAEDDSLVQVVNEVDMDGITVSFVASEARADAGEYKLPLTVYSQYPGEQHIVVYVNHTETERKSVDFK